ncbi:MAG: hypothetical protein WDO56_24720 [Gammaproteobacteria bacterium]
MIRCLRLGPINPSSKHSLGERAKQLVMEARGEVARALGVTALKWSSRVAARSRTTSPFLALSPCARIVDTSSLARSSTLRR